MPNQYTVKRTKVQRLKKFLNPNTPKKQFLMFIAVFMIIGGGYMAYRSFAATGLTGGAGEFTALTPARILDTRDGNGGYTTPVMANTNVPVQITGKGGIPAKGVSAVVMNVTVTGGTANSFLTIWPSGVSKPSVSSINFAKGETIPNQVTVKVGSDGKVNLANAAGGANVIFDVAGFYSDSSGPRGQRFTSLSPARIFDTRTGTGGYTTPIGPNQVYTTQIAGKNGIPASGVKAVVMNVTATSGTANSFLTIWPSGVARPSTSNLNFAVGQTIPNQVTVKLGDDGKVQLYNAAGNANVIFDIAGYFSEIDPVNEASQAGRFVPVNPSRLYDSRTNNNSIKQNPTQVRVTGTNGVDSYNVGAVVMNITATGGTANSFLTAYPTGDNRPPTSNLNFAAGQTIANQATVKVGTQNYIDLYNAVGGVHAILDVAGFYIESEGSTSLAMQANTPKREEVQKYELDFRPLAFPKEQISNPISIYGAPIIPQVYYQPSGEASIKFQCYELPQSQCKPLGTASQELIYGKSVISAPYKFTLNQAYTFTFEAKEYQPGYPGTWTTVSITPVGGAKVPLMTYYNGVTARLVAHDSGLNVSSYRQDYTCDKSTLLAFSIENVKLDNQFTHYNSYRSNFDNGDVSALPVCPGFNRADYTYSATTSGLVATFKSGIPQAQRDITKPTIDSVVKLSNGSIEVKATDNVSVMYTFVTVTAPNGTTEFYYSFDDVEQQLYGKNSRVVFFQTNGAMPKGNYTVKATVIDSSNNVTQKSVQLQLP